MKKLLFLFIGIILMSCSTDDTENLEKINRASFMISNTETINFKLTENFPVEGGPQITEQAEHFKISEIVLNENEWAMYYLYTPEEGFTGTETVKITYYFHNGAEVYDQETTVLTIEVTE